jgi:hypothetical protein
VNDFANLKKLFGNYKEDIIIVIFFLILSILYLGANFFSNEIVAPMDLLLHYPGWYNTGVSVPVFNLERSDILDAVIPQWTFARNSILNGYVPLWEPYIAGGSPVLSLFTSSLLSPSFLVFFIFGGGVGFTFSLLVKLVIAGYGTYKLCRTEMTVLPSIFGGITYMMCGYNASWLMWSHVTTSMWIPWVFCGIILLNKEKKLIRYIFLAFFVALLIFGGFPFDVFACVAIGFLLICWLIYINIKKSGRLYGLKSGLLLSSAVIAGGGLAAVQILPFGEWLTQFDTSWRQGGTPFSLRDLDILWTPFKYTNDFGSHIAPRVEYCGSVGIIALFFSIIAIILILRYRKGALTPLSPIFWAPVSFLIMILVFNIEPISSVFYKLPILNSNLDSRLLVFLGLTFSVIGAYGLDKSVKIATGIETKYKKLYKKFIVLLVIIIIGIQTSNMASIGMSQNAVVPADSFYPETPTISYVQNNLLPGQSVLTTSVYMVSGTITYYGISDWFAHNYHSDLEKDVLNNVVRDAWRTPTAAMYNFDQVNLTSPLMDELSIRYVLAPKITSQTINTTEWKIISVEKGISILENRDCPPGAYISTNSGIVNPSSEREIMIIRYTPTYREYLINSTLQGRLVTSTRYWPGWVSSLNDQPVPIKPYLGILQSVEIPEGISVITFTYVPYSFYLGILVSLTTLILILVIPRKFFEFSHEK